MQVDFQAAIQRQLDEIVSMKQEKSKVILTGKDKTIEHHFVLLKETVQQVKSVPNPTNEEKNLRKYITTEFECLLRKIKVEFIKGNNKLIDAIFNQHNIAIWWNNKETCVVCMRVEGINILF